LLAVEVKPGIGQSVIGVRAFVGYSTVGCKGISPQRHRGFLTQKDTLSTPTKAFLVGGREELLLSLNPLCLCGEMPLW
jgi:hypothetical protein